MFLGMLGGRSPKDIEGLREADTGYVSREERNALKRAEKAEKEFRRSKGYEPDTFLGRMKKRLGK